MRIDVSIIIPVFNPDKKILTCVESILNNTDVSFEVLIIDDGSKSETIHYLKTVSKLKQIKIFRQKNQGVAAARNRGMKLANGKYIVFIDQDDYIDKDYLKTFFQAAERGNYDIVTGGYKRVSSKKTLFQVVPNNKPLGKYLIMAPWARIYKKDFLIKHKFHFLENPIGEDVYLNCIAYQYARMQAISYVGYNWLYNEKSVSNSKQKGQVDIKSVKTLLNSIFSELKKRNKLNQEIEYYFVKYVTWYVFFSILKSRESLKFKAKNVRLFLNNFEYLFASINKNPYISIIRNSGESILNLFAVNFIVFIVVFGGKANLLKK
jgi:glycosyltransferase involved in cell wall biosynthesis